MNPTVARIEVLEDGSGAPAVVHVGGFSYACDFLGAARVTCTATPSGRIAHGVAARAMASAREAYCELLFQETDSAWLEANLAFYRADNGT